jgi:hypothetical protein
LSQIVSLQIPKPFKTLVDASHTSLARLFTSADLPDEPISRNRIKPSPFGALAVVLIRKKNARAAPVTSCAWSIFVAPQCAGQWCELRWKND